MDGWPEIRPDLEKGRRQPFAEYFHAQYTAGGIRQETTDVLTQVDVVAMPTGSTLGDKADAATTVIRGREVPARSRTVHINGLVSLTRNPALSVPCGFALEDRLPVGLQLMGARMAEPLLLRVAHAYEQATEWHLRQPPI